MRTEAGKWDEYYPENNTPCSLDPCSFFSEMIYKVLAILKKKRYWLYESFAKILQKLEFK